MTTMEAHFVPQRSQSTQRKISFKINNNFSVSSVRSVANSFCLLSLAFFLWNSPAFAVPETTGVRITDVTTSSFSVVWMTDVVADPSLELYADSSMQERLMEGIVITAMPAASSKVSQAAREKGIIKVRASGLQPETTYYVRTVTKDSLNSDSVSYSPVQEITTAASISLVHIDNGSSVSLANDLIVFPVYIQPSDTSTEPGLGDLIILDEQAGRYPISAFAGDGVALPEGLLDLNNLFGSDGLSLVVAGNEKITLTVYRAGNLSSLLHYRKVPINTTAVSVSGLIKGFFADINLDEKVDEQDFTLFKGQYRSLPADSLYNPDYNFVDDSDGIVDVREFSKFAREYGRTDVQ